MSKIDRYKIFIRYIKSIGIAPSQKEFGKLLGYGNESYFSQIINGQVEEPKDFMAKIKKLVPDLNTEWLQSGEGEMIVRTVQSNSGGDNINGNNVRVTKTESDKLLDVILKQADQLSVSQAQISKSQEQIDRLITLIERK